MIAQVVAGNQQPPGQAGDEVPAQVRTWLGETRRKYARFAVAVGIAGAVWLALVTLASPTLPF